MKKKLISIVSVVTAVTLGFVLVLENTNGLTFGKAEGTTYSISFSNAHNEISWNGSATVYTDLGNAITIDSVITRTGSEWASIASSGYIRNSSVITGMTSMTIVLASGSAAPIVWYVDSDYNGSTATLVSAGTYTYVTDFDNASPNYFTIRNSSTSSDVVIMSMTITYTCE